MYLLKCVGLLIAFIWTALVFHHGHDVHKCCSCSAVRGAAIFLYQHFQQAPLKSRRISAARNRRGSGCTAAAVPVRVCRRTEDSPALAMQPHTGLCTRYSN